MRSLAATVALVLLTVWGTTRLSFESPSARRSSVDTLRSVSQEIIRLTNRERAQRSLQTLAAETQLRRIACHHTRDMMVRDFIRHENPDGESPADRVAKLHRRLIGEVGENLWERTGRRVEPPNTLAEKIVSGWMNSPPHRKNILRPRFSHLGVCTLRRGQTVRGTQVFARVRAYLREPLPRTAPAGHALPAHIERTFPSDAAIDKYDFWDPERAAPITDPLIFTDTLQLPDSTGPVRLRFYMPQQPNQYRIHWGPQIRIVPPQ